VIQLHDEVQVAVPGWMLDPVCCQQLTDETRPRIAVSALCTLGELLDSQSGLATTSVVAGRGTPHDTGGDDARPSRASTDATDADVRPPRGLAGTSSTRPTPMPRPDRPAAARRPAGRGLDTEGR
jgi:hypothetical protein